MSTSTAEPVTLPEWTLGDRIWKARRTAGMEQSDLADACGVSRALVSMWERDQSEPRVSQLEAVADLTGIDFGWLAGMGSRTGSFTSLVGLPPTLTPELPFAPAARQLVAVGSG